MLSAVRPLRHRNFALIWTAGLISNIGSWMQTVAVGVFVTARTGQASWTGLVAAAAFLPIGLLSPVGGALADRLDRRRWLFWTTVGETVFATLLALLTASGRAGPGLVTVLVTFGGATAALGFPAYQAMLPDLVGPDDLGAAVSLSSTQFNLGRVVGPAAAGIAIVAGGYQWAFAINAGSFVAVLIALRLVRLKEGVSTAAPEPLRSRLIEGARAAWSRPPTRMAVILISCVALTVSPFIALVPAVALTALHTKAAGVSVLVTAQGVGAVTGALCLTPLARRFGRRRVLLADVAVTSGAVVAYGLSPDLPAAAAFLAVVGAAYIGILAGCNTMVQISAPPGLRGRLIGIYLMALGILYPIGALVQGWIADAVGVRAVTVGGAVLLVVVMIAGLGRRIPEVPLTAPISEPLSSGGADL